MYYSYYYCVYSALFGVIEYSEFKILRSRTRIKKHAQKPVADYQAEGLKERKAHKKSCCVEVTS